MAYPVPFKRTDPTFAHFMGQVAHAGLHGLTTAGMIAALKYAHLTALVAPLLAKASFFLVVTATATYQVTHWSLQALSRKAGIDRNAPFARLAIWSLAVANGTLILTGGIWSLPATLSFGITMAAFASLHTYLGVNALSSSFLKPLDKALGAPPFTIHTHQPVP